MSKSNEPASQRRGRDPQRESFWRERLARHADSGLSIRAFCRRQALKETAFYFWRREIHLRDAQARAGRPVAGAFVELACRELASPEPAEGVAPARRELVEPVAAPPAAPALEPLSAIELLLPGDRRLLIRDDFDASLLRRVLAVLEGVPC